MLMHTPYQARMLPEVVQGTPPPTTSASAQKSPFPSQVMTEERRESCVANESARSHNNAVLRKHRLQQLEDMPAAKRCRLESTNNELHRGSAPRSRLSPPVVPDLHSHSTPKATQRERIVMDCVEVVPLREIMRRRGAEMERVDKERQLRKDDPGYRIALDAIPETPFIPRMTRELLERNEIGEIQHANCQAIHLTEPILPFQCPKHPMQCCGPLGRPPLHVR
jgi:hypothetical protein